MHKAKVEWEAPEFIHVEKTTDWYWALWIIATALGVTFIIIDNILLAVVILLSAFTLSLNASRPPRIERYAFSEHGLKVGKKLYPTDAIDSFWIEMYEDHHVKLLLRMKQGLFPVMSVLIGDIDGEELRNIARTHLIEERIEEPLAQKVMEYLGF